MTSANYCCATNFSVFRAPGSPYLSLPLPTWLAPRPPRPKRSETMRAIQCVASRNLPTSPIYPYYLGPNQTSRQSSVPQRNTKRALSISASLFSLLPPHLCTVCVTYLRTVCTRPAVTIIIITFFLSFTDQLAPAACAQVERKNALDSDRQL